jgi:hypothetical protein
MADPHRTITKTKKEGLQLGGIRLCLNNNNNT